MPIGSIHSARLSTRSASAKKPPVSRIAASISPTQIPALHRTRSLAGDRAQRAAQVLLDQALSGPERPAVTPVDGAGVLREVGERTLDGGGRARRDHKPLLGGPDGGREQLLPL